MVPFKISFSTQKMDEYQLVITEKFDYSLWYNVMMNDVVNKVWTTNPMIIERDYTWDNLVLLLKEKNEFIRALNDDVFKTFVNSNTLEILWAFPHDSAKHADIVRFYQAVLCVLEICNENDEIKLTNSIIVNDLNRIKQLSDAIKDKSVSVAILHNLLSNLVVDFHRNLISIYVENIVFFDWFVKFIIDDGESKNETHRDKLTERSLFDAAENMSVNMLKYIRSTLKTNKKIFN